MNKNNTLQIAVISILVILLGISFSAYLRKESSPQNEQKSEAHQTVRLTLMIDDLYFDKQVTANNGDTVLEVLEMLDKESSELNLVTKEYPGLGVLVESINGKTNGTDGKYWQYFVDEVMPQIGADKLELKDGDSVDWRFEESKF